MSPKSKVDSKKAGKRKGLRPGYVILIVLLAVAALILSQVRFDLPVETLAGEFANDESRFIEIDGVNVHYRDEGEGETLVLLHGWSASLHTWDSWAETLKDDFRVIRLDLPAFGLTGPAAGADYSIDYYADFLDHFLDALEVTKIYLAGNSLGGGITWFYAAKHPEKVNKIILVDAAGYKMEAPPIMKLGASKAVQSVIRYLTPRYAIRFLVNQVYGEKERVAGDTVWRYYRLLLREGNRGVLFTALERTLERQDEDVTQLLGGIGIPALIMWGEKDAWIPLELAYRFEQDIPHARLITYETAGHIPMEELPAETVSDARLFLLEE